LENHHRVLQEIPRGIPLSRDHEHKIELLGSTPPNKSIYRNPHQQKGEVEKKLQDMLDLDIIQPRTSSFSAPIVMVRKKYNDWSMCLDYRDVNKITIKDKFLIPNIDELLDELHGVDYFKTLYLKSIYHQIILREEDTPKIDFKTYEEKYEFLVMPFELNSFPSTFQSLMNKFF